MKVDVRGNAVREYETLGIFSLALLNAVSVAAGRGTRVVKLMPASRCSPRSEYAIGIRSNLAISEIDEPSSHFKLNGNNSYHTSIIHSLRKLHQPTAITRKLNTRLNESPNRR